MHDFNTLWHVFSGLSQHVHTKTDVIPLCVFSIKCFHVIFSLITFSIHTRYKSKFSKTFKQKIKYLSKVYFEYIYIFTYSLMYTNILPVEVFLWK